MNFNSLATTAVVPIGSSVQDFFARRAKQQVSWWKTLALFREKLSPDKSTIGEVADWRLGDANGRAIVQAAKDHSSMPVVVVSGYVAEAFQAAEPLADLYLEKPVNPEELVTIVNELLKTGEKAATSNKQNR